MLSDESDNSGREESDKIGAEFGSYGTFGTVLGGLLLVVGLPLGVTISTDELCGGDWGSLTDP